MKEKWEKIKWQKVETGNRVKAPTTQRENEIEQQKKKKKKKEKKTKEAVLKCQQSVKPSVRMTHVTKLRNLRFKKFLKYIKPAEF